MAKEIRRGLLIHMSPHEAVVSALVLQALVDVYARTGRPVYEPQVYSKVCDFITEFRSKCDVSPKDFLETVAILQVAGHVERLKMPVGSSPFPMPCLRPSRAGVKDAQESYELFRKVMSNEQTR